MSTDIINKVANVNRFYCRFSSTHMALTMELPLSNMLTRNLLICIKMFLYEKQKLQFTSLTVICNMQKIWNSLWRKWIFNMQLIWNECVVYIPVNMQLIWNECVVYPLVNMQLIWNECVVYILVCFLRIWFQAFLEFDDFF